MNKLLTLLVLCCLGITSMSYAQTTILDFEAPPGVTTTFDGFGGLNGDAAGFGPVADPVNPANMALELNRPSGGLCFAGAASTSLPVAIDLTGLSEICFDYFEPNTAGNVKIKLEDSPTGADWEFDFATTNGWGTYCVSSSAPSVANGNIAQGHVYNKVVVFPNFSCGLPNPPDAIAYFDNLIINAQFGVTFQVDMCEQISAGTFDPINQAVYVTGGNANQTGNYADCGVAMTDANGDGTYIITQSYPENYNIAYKFLIGDAAWANTGACTGQGFENALPAPCGFGAFGDREFLVTADAVLPAVCFGSCEACTGFCPSCPAVKPFCEQPYIEGKCMFLLELEDAGGDGWDGASLTVSIGEDDATEYKMTPIDGKCKYIPIYAADGETIDIAYWNGANETEHGWKLYTPIESIATTIDGTALSFSSSPTANTTFRVKADCIDVACEGETLDLVLSIDFFGNALYNPEELFWEIRDMDGTVVFGANPGDYSGIADGGNVRENVTLNKCRTYTFVAGDAGGDFDFWHANVFTFLVADGSGYGTPAPGPYDIFVSDQPQFTGTSVGGMRMYDLTIPCYPEIQAAGPVKVTINTGGADGTDNIANADCSLNEDDMVLPIAIPAVCGAGKCHVNCAAPAVTMDVMIDGVVVGTYNFDLPNDYSGGNFVDANGDGMPEGIIVDLSAGVSVGTHNLTYKATYNCDVYNNLVMAYSSTELIVASESNPSLTCNDLVHVSLQEGGNDCRVIITPDMVLEDVSACATDYIVEVVETGTNYVDASFCGQTLTYRVSHIFSDNICWGTILVEDKLAPKLTCVDFDASCLHPNALDLPAYTEEDEFCTAIELAVKGVDITPFGGRAQASVAGGTYAGSVPTDVELAAGANYTLGATGYAAFGVSETTFASVGCTPIGEIVKDFQVTVNVSHTDIEDLAIVLLPPAAVQAQLAATTGRGGYDNYPFITLMDFGTCATVNEQASDMEVTFDIGFMIPTIGSNCDSDPAIEGTYAPIDAAAFAAVENLLYTDLAGDWTIVLYDDDDNRWLAATNPNVFVNIGYGNLEDACLNITHGFPEPYSVFDCTLEGVTLLDEAYVETNCDQGEWNGAKVVRVWQAIDEKGNSSTCTQTISLRAPTLDQITVPGDVAFECGELSDEVNPDPMEAGIPAFDCFDLAGDDIHSLCDVSYSYEDITLTTCGNSKKIIRTWTILNWCSGVNHTFEQIIKIEDTQGPVIDEEAILFTGTDAYDCQASVDLSAAVIDACSGVTSITATYIEGGGPYDPNGTLVIVDVLAGELLENLPFGPTDVVISAKDGCLNQTELDITINVVDDIAPVAICDDQLNISLGGDGTARVHATDFDEGSYDNCGAVSLGISTQDGNYAEYVEVDCSDAGILTLYLLVTDENGNENRCWAEILVEDALSPVITCPADKTLNCDDDLDNPFGEAEAIDNCNAQVTFVDAGELDQCKAGTLTRTWTATDGSDKSADVSCTQRITVLHVSDFTVQFPADATISTCPDDLGATGSPQTSDVDCELLGITHDDVVLTIAENACYTIERTWTVINTCIYDQGNPANTDLGIPQPLPRTYQDDGDGYFTYVQIIEVIDNDAPTIDCPGDQNFCDLTDGCEGQVDLTITATDGCSQEGSLTYSYSIDAFNDGTFDIVDNGNDASGVYPYGTHRIKWVVEDGCGNTSTCEYLFTVEDCKNPTPVCLNGISIENMQTGCVDIWASDLLEYAFDNCSDASFVEGSVKMRREGALTSPQTSMTLCCEDVGTVIVEIWVEDEAGNADYCTTYIIVQDNLNNCDDSGEPTDDSRTVAGAVRNEIGQDVQDVTVTIDGMDDYVTGSNGGFHFDAPTNADYTITPSKDMNPLNGVSTFDLVLISQHVLGQQILDSPYQMIAADVNNDGNISTFDVVQLRQLILYIVTDFVDNSSWRFVDADYTFPNAQNPWMETFPEVIELNDLSAESMANDFVAVKIGDVDGNAQANNLLGTDDRNATGTLNLNIDDATMTKGQNVTIDFRASDFNNINGYQFTLNFDAAAMTFVNVEAGALNVTEGNFGMNFLNEGLITTSWNAADAKSMANDAVLFSLTFAANTAANVSDVIKVSSRYTTAEAYSASELMDVALTFNTEEGTIATNGAFELYQNTPNPFNGATVIGFNLPTATAATLKVYDVAGKVLKVVEADYAKGYNQISINSNELNATGVLYYQLDTATNSATKKMIVIK